MTELATFRLQYSYGYAQILPIGNHSLVKALVVHVGSFGDIFQDQHLAVPLKQFNVATISALLSPCRPAAIFWRIRAIIVDAINRVSWRRLLPHVRIEARKIISPAIAHSNSSATIVLKRLIVGIETSRPNATPRIIFWRKVPINCCAVSNVSSTNQINIQTTATFRVTANQVMADHIDDRSAFAQTFPCRQTFRDIGSSIQYRETPKNLTSSVNQPHGCMITP